MTLDEGRIRTWRLPAFSALLMFFRASFRTEVRTILAVLWTWCREGDSQILCEMRYLPTESVMLAFGGPKSVESALKRGFCPPSVDGERRIEEEVSVVAASSRLDLVGGCCIGRCGSVVPSSIALPGLREGASFSRASQVMMTITDCFTYLVRSTGLDEEEMRLRLTVMDGWEEEVELFSRAVKVSQNLDAKWS